MRMLKTYLFFLQSLDHDQNTTNRITISDETRSILSTSLLINNGDFTKNFRTSLDDINDILNIVNTSNKTNYQLISKEEALLYYQNTLKSIANITLNLSNPTPYLIDVNGNITSITSIKTR